MVEGDALEKRYTGNGIVSSNLTPTALYGENRYAGNGVGGLLAGRQVRVLHRPPKLKIGIGS